MHLRFAQKKCRNLLHNDLIILVLRTTNETQHEKKSRQLNVWLLYCQLTNWCNEICDCKKKKKNDMHTKPTTIKINDNKNNSTVTTAPTKPSRFKLKLEKHHSIWWWWCFVVNLWAAPLNCRWWRRFCVLRDAITLEHILPSFCEVYETQCFLTCIPTAFCYLFFSLFFFFLSVIDVHWFVLLQVFFFYVVVVVCLVFDVFCLQFHYSLMLRYFVQLILLVNNCFAT